VDPLVALASTLDAGLATMAVLLGSGVSRAAQIPTGYDVVVDLIRRVVAASGEDPDGPVAWWVEGHGRDADYSVLLALSPPPRRIAAAYSRVTSYPPTKNGRTG
jgi:hypothetical protein